MSSLLTRIFIKNWPRKLVAFIAAIFVWFLVNQSMSATRNFSDIPVRVINVDPDQTVVGQLPSGFFKRRISISVTGSKSFIEDIEGEDLQIVINAQGKRENWIASIDKNDLFSTSQEVEIRKYVTEVSANDIYIKLSDLVTEEIPVTITTPIGDPPKGYQYIDVWPKHLYQKVSGPKDQVTQLKENGLKVTFDLNLISKEELDALFDVQVSSTRDEISFMVPASWKKVEIPFNNDQLEPLNDLRAKFLRIDFLKQELIPVGLDLPVAIFFPTKTFKTINPETYSLAETDLVEIDSGFARFTLPLYVQDVSRLFLNVVRNNLQLTILAAPRKEQKVLHWATDCIDETLLENDFVSATLKQNEQKFSGQKWSTESTQSIRYRFRDYLRKLVLLTEDGAPLELSPVMKRSTIVLEQEK